MLVFAVVVTDIMTDRPRMMETHSGDRSSRLETVSASLAAAALVSGCAVLISWIWNLPGLSSIHPRLGGMGAHAALGFALGGASLLLLRAPVTPARRIVASVCAALIVLLAVLSLGQWIDRTIGGILPGRMPTATAEVFLAFGLALLAIDVSIGRWRPAEFLAFFGAAIALFAIIAYTFGSLSLFGSLTGRPLAFHTLVLMTAFAFALLAARPRSGLMSLATSSSVAGLFVRRMQPAVVGIPLLAGWGVIALQRAGLFPPGLTLSYYAVTLMVVFATMTWQIAGSLHRIDTERRAAEDQVQRLNAELEQRVADRTAQLERVNSELEAFSYSISHDLRAPLRHIDGFAQMLVARCADKLDETGRRHLAVICEGAQSMGRMIDDLLSLARLDRQQVVAAETDLNQVVRDVIQTLRADIGARRIEWTCDPLPAVRCDPGLMKLVFTNLLSNAVKYTGKRDVARISISLQHRHEGAVFAVSDNGAGFDQRYHEKLFGVFHRLHRADEFEGTGIGLATVRRIVHKHGGRIWAEAAVDRGATFYFTLGTANL
jgi:signal transduction histidine kinase